MTWGSPLKKIAEFCQTWQQYAFNPSTWEAEAGGLGIQDQLALPQKTRLLGDAFGSSRWSSLSSTQHGPWNPVDLGSIPASLLTQSDPEQTEPLASSLRFSAISSSGPRVDMGTG